MEKNYYDENLNAQKLLAVYDTKIPKIKEYLEGEINFVKSYLTGKERVLELAAGYGRIIRELAPCCSSILGIDISSGNVEYSKEYLKNFPNGSIVKMDVHNISLKEKFDRILCLQNGLSATKMTEKELKKVVDLLSPGGQAFFSSFSEKIWNIRLEWFQEQASKGLLGAIDWNQTRDGKIICQDGFVARTYTVKDFKEIGTFLNLPFKIQEVNDASLFLILTKE